MAVRDTIIGIRETSCSPFLQHPGFYSTCVCMNDLRPWQCRRNRSLKCGIQLIAYNISTLQCTEDSDNLSTSGEHKKGWWVGSTVSSFWSLKFLKNIKNKRYNYPWNRPRRPILLWDVEDSSVSGHLPYTWLWVYHPIASGALCLEEHTWCSCMLEAEPTPGPYCG
jgi:hypothetical protein